MKLSRREALASGAGLLALPGGLSAAPAPTGQSLWYRQAAARWEEALPLGNGRLGAMVFGRVAQERLQLNEDTLWSGSPYTPDNPEALAALPEVRRLIDAGRFKEAADLASAKMMAKPLSQMAYGSLGDLLLDFDGAVKPSSYARELDLETAVARTRYAASGVAFAREAFASAADQVIVLHLTAQQGRFGFDLRYRGPRETRYTAAAYQGAATALDEKKPVDWLMTEPAVAVHSGTTWGADGPGAWLARGRNQNGPDTPAGLRFAMRVKVTGDGRITESDSGIGVRGASRVTLLIAGATSFVNFRDVSGDPEARVRDQTEAAARQEFEALKRAHIREYRRLYAGVSLQLGAGDVAARPTDHRVAVHEQADDPALAALYFQYARYLLISSSRRGTQPANLQGIWNEGTNPPWGSKYTININTEMNYWPADPAGLSECVEPLLRMAEELAVTGASTAKTMYGARGWVAHHNTDLWRAAAPIDGPLWGLWPCGGAWLCNTLWDHWDYTRDPAVLQRLYPLLKGASEFFLDTLKEDRRGLVTSPSISPENAHPFGSSVCAGPAMDRQIVRDLFAHTAAAGRLLKRDAELLAQIDQARARLAPDAIGKAGQLQEWLEDWDAEAP
ncbi:MAG: glycoside hydrolase family 95 protein, partial [Rubrivivax sp.]